MIDDVIEPNGWLDGGRVIAFVDPEAVRTPRAVESNRFYDASRIVRWDVPSAMSYLCGMLNFNQRYIRNPSFDYLSAVLGIDRNLLQNVEIPWGATLPEALDRLLDPYGYGWYLHLDAPGLRSIRVFKRGFRLGNVHVGVQRPGQDLNLESTNCKEFDVSFDTSRLVNKVRMFGAFEEYQQTFELKRAWSVEQDELKVDDLDETKVTAINKRVHRDWVLNEGGDYSGGMPLRPEFGRVAFNLWEATGTTPAHFSPGRRKFLPIIGLDVDGLPEGLHAGIKVEYEHPDNGWEVVPWSYERLEHECGIRFTWTKPKDDYWGYYAVGEEAKARKIRVTASVRSDVRLVKTSSDVQGALTSDVIPVVIDARNKLFYRTGGSGLTGTVDDGPRAVGLGQALLQAWNRAEVSGDVVLEGIDRLVEGIYEIGSTITDIFGRNVNLDASGTYSYFPVIVAVAISPPDQSITLHLEVVRPGFRGA